jgi:tetratricopeptide (TPR) repeat protein
VWLTGALDLAGDNLAVRAKASTYLASVDSDRADYGRALVRFDEAIALAREVGESRREVYAVSMVGRVHLLRGDLDEADATLRGAIELGERERWLAFLPWPQALLGELELARGRVETASSVLSQAFARACQLGDPCWEGVSARGLALVAEARGDPDSAFALLADARARANRLTDSYVWLDAYILDALCTLGVRHRHPASAGWVAALRHLASRTGMRELTVRALLHAAQLGDDGAEAGARLLAMEVDNPVLRRNGVLAQP